MRGSTARGIRNSSSNSAIPIQRFEVHQLGAAGIGDVGQVQPAIASAGEIPQQPGIDVAEKKLARLCFAARAGHVVQQPLQLKAAEIAGERQSGFGAKAIRAAVSGVLRDELIDAGILPDQRIVQRFAAALDPKERWFRAGW